MKNSGMKIGIFLAVVALFFTGQVIWAEPPACELEISGTIIAVIDDQNAIVVGVEENEAEAVVEVTVYGIPLAYLDKWEVVEIDAVESVSIKAHYCPSSEKIVACEISFDDGEWMDLGPRRHKIDEAQTSGGARQGLGR